MELCAVFETESINTYDIRPMAAPYRGEKGLYEENHDVGENCYNREVFDEEVPFIR